MQLVKWNVNLLIIIEMFLKKKDSMNTILKYLFGSLILKGDLPDIKTDEGILLLGSAAK